jgi:lipopolysaccharide/colanic/teichoic acid biosynthesis glycosyltransferase
MSVIGPRPHMLKHIQCIQIISGTTLCKLNFGWAQVSGFREETKELSEMKDQSDFGHLVHRKLDLLS